MKQRILGLVLLALLMSGCVGDDRLQTTRFTIEPEDATFVEVELLMSTGNLILAGGEADKFSGEFIHQQSDYKPIYEYEIERNRGHLIIEQPSIAADTEDGTHYISTVNLSTGIPMDLTFVKAEGNSDINLQGLLLNSLTVSLGEKDTVLDLSGDYPTLTNVDVLSGFGQDTIRLNGNYPSLISLSVTLNNQQDVIDVIGTYDVLTNLYIEAGDGPDNVQVRGEYPELEAFTIITGDGSDTIVVDGSFAEAAQVIIDSGTGDDLIDLTGEWTQNMNFTIISEEDSVTLRLPDDVGVYVEATNRTAEVNAEGLVADKSVYTNRLYGEAEITLTIRLDTSTGEVINIFELQME